jgi:hypothetical protein
MWQKLILIDALQLLNALLAKLIAHLNGQTPSLKPTLPPGPYPTDPTDSPN